MDALWSLVLALAALYAVLGFLFAIPFHIGGMVRLDPAARGTSPWFRLLVTPGVIALWPVLLAKWMRRMRRPPLAAPDAPFRPRTLRAVHGFFIMLAAIAIPLLLGAALMFRPSFQVDEIRNATAENIEAAGGTTESAP